MVMYPSRWCVWGEEAYDDYIYTLHICVCVVVTNYSNTYIHACDYTLRYRFLNGIEGGSDDKNVRRSFQTVVDCSIHFEGKLNRDINILDWVREPV